MSVPRFVQLITYFTLFYPIVMSVVWICGSLLYKLIIKDIKIEEVEKVQEQKFTILVPTYNEQDEIVANIKENLKLNYDNFEMWLIDDKSTDNTLNEIKKINHEKVKVYENEENLGKAKTLNKFIKLVETEYFLVLDSDTILDKDALKYINYSIAKDKQEAKENDKENKFVGYTGNITVKADKKNRTYNVQKVEYRSFIDMIKRSQFILTKSIMTLSGACSCYLKDAVVEIGGFNETNATEDINISWRFNDKGLRLKYLSQVKAQVSTPLNVYDVIRQRQRWTVGLLQTIKQNFKGIFSLKNNFLKLYILEIIASSTWAFTLFFSTIYYILCILMFFYEDLRLVRFIYGIVLVLIFSILLSLIAYKISENNNEKISVFLKNYFWFPFAYFLIQPLGFVSGVYSSIFHKQEGKWRQVSKERNRYVFATVSDLIITFIIFRVILEVIQDSYTTFSSVAVLTLLLVFLTIKILFLILYYLKLRVGDKFVDRKYPLLLNVSLYISIITIIQNIYQLYLFNVKEIPVSEFYRYPAWVLTIYLIIIITLTIIFNKKINKNKK